MNELLQEIYTRQHALKINAEDELRALCALVEREGWFTSKASASVQAWWACEQELERMRHERQVVWMKLTEREQQLLSGR